MPKRGSTAVAVKSSKKPKTPTRVKAKAPAAKRPPKQAELINLREEATARETASTEIEWGARTVLSAGITLVFDDAFRFMDSLPENSIHAVVTDPPYGVVEYEQKDHAKLRLGRGGVWRIPPSFDGATRIPLPRFTVLTASQLTELSQFFERLSRSLHRVMAPGAHLFIASNPLVSSLTFQSIQRGGLEKRGEVIRLVQTLRGGDKPKGAEEEFDGVSMMPRSCWEPWGLFRKPFTGTAAANLRKWGTGGLRRINDAEPFKDVIQCSPTRGVERKIAPHPSLKPQRFMRQIVRASLPLGKGLVFDPFAGSASTLAAAASLGYEAIGTERDSEYASMAQRAFPALVKLRVGHDAERDI